ncbi:hypothetical protein COB21_02765 [Candidatus Aerophobetes bacterium]|uniref:Tetratricopeptide repeat-like domain-containing protein n=1 Tax=Aerophobetes bacterium TaxID=2030807 RepID=A0A2A4X6I9_UNCAE|nr:MAG: hypothetical protein COB21_02765 [Candidatus Aerophobetes bacterium]
MADLILWLQERKKGLKITFLAVLYICCALGLASYTFAKRKNVNMNAHQLFATWASCDQGKKEQASLKNLNSFLEKYTFLQKSYDNKIVQALIARGQQQGSLPFVDRALNHLKDPFCKTFSAATLQISSGNIKQALEISRRLKQELLAHLSVLEVDSKLNPFYEHIHFFNLYRIGFLFEKLSKEKQAQEVWKELKTTLFHPESKKFGQGAKSFLKVFSTKGFSFEDYLEKKQSEAA